MIQPTLLSDPTCLHLRLLDASSTAITAVVTTTSQEAKCPLCHRHSARIHSRYVRQVADLPWMGCAVRLQLHVRRFFCTNLECKRQIFTERLPTVVASYARRTIRLADVFTLIAFALGGEAGSRLAAGIGLITSPDTLLRLIHRQADQPAPTPRVLGVDDFAFAKRRKYGTIFIDLERRVPIEILPDREAATLATWLTEHPGVQIISRDRGGPYADGSKQGAPDAQQVADRWHLLANLSEALKSLFARKQVHLKALLQKPSEAFSEEEARKHSAWYKGCTNSKLKRHDAHHQERVERYHRVHEMRRQGAALRIIAHQLGLSRTTVNKYLSMEHPPERKRGILRGSIIDPYKGYVIGRWNDGVRNAQVVYREIQAMGYTGSNQPIQRYFVQFRREKDIRKCKQVDPSKEPPVKAPPRRPPSYSQVAHWITMKEDQRLPWQEQYLTRLCEADQEIREANELIQEFTGMLRERKGEQFDAWLDRVEQQGVKELCGFARSLKKDYEAVKAGLTLPWSQGVVEGHIQRLKLLKRQSYGRASLQTLRKRVLQCG